MTYQNPAKVTPEYLNSRWRKVFHRLVLVYYNVVFHTQYRLKVTGQENIPPKWAGSFIVVANHTSTLDPPVMGVALNYRQIAYMGKKELFRTWLGRLLYTQLGAFSVNRQKLEMTTIRSAKTVLESNGEWVLGMFPEGTRSQDGETLQAKKGVAFIAKMNTCGILPIGIAHQGKLTSKGLGRDILAHIGAFIPYQPNPDLDAVTAQLQDTLAQLKQNAANDRI